MTTERPVPATSLRRRADRITTASITIAALVTVASMCGLFTGWPYRLETENWLLQARGQDIGNLLAVIVLVTAALRMRRGSHRATQVWIGAQFYLLYAYIVYAFAVHLNALFLVYVAILGLVTFSLLAVLPAHLHLDRADAHRRGGRFAGGVLIGTGVLFALLWFSELLPALFSGQIPESLELAGLIVNPVHVIDLSVVLPGMIVVGALGIRRIPPGTALTLPLLVFSTLMALSIVAAMILITITGHDGTLAPAILVTAVAGINVTAATILTRSPRNRGSEAEPSTP
ncbi:hypothetical protein [uncultured Microbacterium sp.]|uniref:Uncharacterized protein n=1 Tax=uncultured Microbacterium sp. TaxID=191216 RepID=A0A1Y5NZP8_9MICO|nr:hypothetical protein [uncultured Microbacterium sp.]SBS71893.1 conserved membrane hypothetical protein [uncultured Microbacterium sp.]